MERVTAILSMLHEPADQNSATRLFRGEPVLSWTLDRICRSDKVDSIAILCWQDQLTSVEQAADDASAHILCKNPRVAMPGVDAVAAARRWAEGWRSGLLMTCDFDLGFHAPWVVEIIRQLNSEAVLLVDPSAGLVDPKIVADLVDRANSKAELELCFTQAPPGLGGALLRPALVERLAGLNSHPGRILHYLPDQPMRDPIGSEGCVPVPTPVSRSNRNFRLDSQRQIERLSAASVHLNGTLVSSDAEDLVSRLKWTADIDAMPRQVTLELNTNRNTSATFWPGSHVQINREPMSVKLASRIVGQLDEEVRLTIGGVGDPLLHPSLPEIISAARAAGVRAIHVETDLLPDSPEMIDQLVDLEIDVVSVRLPAMTSEVYKSIMGVDRYIDVIENIKRFVLRRHARNSGLPILSPVFAKCQANLQEMEAWYDQWLTALGAAVIIGPSDFGGLIPDISLVDMSPLNRKPCSRLWSRMTILSNGKAVTCEEDVTGKQTVGDAQSQTIREIWREGMSGDRTAQKQGCFGSSPVCAGCREWHRP